MNCFPELCQTVVLGESSRGDKHIVVPGTCSTRVNRWRLEAEGGIPTYTGTLNSSKQDFFVYFIIILQSFKCRLKREHQFVALKCINLQFQYTLWN